jgi:hypothetical protein
MEYILTNFILYVRRNFKNVTIELAIHSHSAPIFRLRRISIARGKKILHLREELKQLLGLYIKYAKKGALDSQPQVIKFTSCLLVVGGSLRLLPPLKLVAMI